MSIHDIHDVRRNRSCDARWARLEFRDVHDVRFYWCPWCDDGSCATTTSATTPSGRSTTLTLDGLRGTTSTVAPSGGSTSAMMATPRGLLFGVNAEGTCTSTTTGLDLRAARCSPPSWSWTAAYHYVPVPLSSRTMTRCSQTAALRLQQFPVVARTRSRGVRHGGRAWQWSLSASRWCVRRQLPVVLPTDTVEFPTTSLTSAWDSS